MVANILAECFAICQHRFKDSCCISLVLHYGVYSEYTAGKIIVSYFLEIFYLVANPTDHPVRLVMETKTPFRSPTDTNILVSLFTSSSTD